MTNEQIRELAKQSGFEVHDVRLNFRKELITFARAIAQRTRDECAAVCEETLKQDGNWTPIGWKFSAAIRSMTK